MDRAQSLESQRSTLLYGVVTAVAKALDPKGSYDEHHTAGQGAKGASGKPDKTASSKDTFTSVSLLRQEVGVLSATMGA